MVFTKSILRKNLYMICLIAVNIVHILYFYLDFLLIILAVGYNTELSISSIGFYRFRFYISFVLICCQSSCLILASIDRTLMISLNAETRKCNTRRLIVTSLISLILFFSVIEIHGLLFIEILQYESDYFVCFDQPGAYTTFLGYHALLVNGFVPSQLMAIFRLWTVKNIRSVRHRIPNPHVTNTEYVTIGRPHIIQSKDKQLIRMLLVDIVTFIIFKFSVTILLIYQQITQYHQKSSE
ncbi:unnamed protein product [Rotaria sordida]|uniref:G-protein coupled receptors family 1 profile domain-containing protein n=1 Tax=Rotaria sordida TaxID=392033 RepID=A0A814ALT4_9BILA|nr:unnamed protein product [Rotaria sordida]CAF0916770.1 unnamed protein product [Rotaria sordida]CAF3866340.1 unnamed protein product [Rotaria sordida]CAF4054172.1 unnamed protein product [Rotaria sordida]